MPIKKSARTVKWTPFLHRQLQDPELALGFLLEALARSDRDFLRALREVVDAYGGVAKLAAHSGLNRESLYKTLSGERSAKLSSVSAILRTVGVIKTGRRSAAA